MTVRNEKANIPKAIADSHKELNRLIERLEQCTTPTAQSELAKAALISIHDYIVTNISHEERMMYEKKWSGWAEHNQGHESMIEQIDEMIGRCNEYKRDDWTSCAAKVRFMLHEHQRIFDDPLLNA